MVWILFILSQIADVWSTAYALDRGAVESNPVIRWLMKRLGKGWAPIKIAIACGGAWIIWKNAGDAGVAVLAAVFFLISLHNYRLRK